MHREKWKVFGGVSAMRRRVDSKPTIRLSIWRIVDGKYFADKAELEKVVVASGRSEDELRRRLGAGYSHLVRALEGQGLGIWEVSHVEWGVASY